MRLQIRNKLMRDEGGKKSKWKAMIIPFIPPFGLPRKVIQ